MPAFDVEHFSRELLTEMLFYEENFGLIGTVSLVDTAGNREQYLASFDPDEGAFIFEQATEWAPMDEDEMSYALAVEGTVVDTYEAAGELAEELYARAAEENLSPHLQILYEDVG